MKSCNGVWRNCANAAHTLNRGWPVMRCRLTGKHPDDCAAIVDTLPKGEDREDGLRAEQGEA